MSIETANTSPALQPLINAAKTAVPVQAPNLDRVQAERVLPAEKASSSQSVDRELARAIEQVQVMMDLRSRSVEFTTDESSGTRVVKVVDSASGDVIRQMPAEELLSFMRNLTRMLGTFIDKTT
jgi:flagellar protein FlaG